MAKLRIHNFAVSIDGYGAGPSQSIANPLGGVARHYTDGPDVSENAREEGRLDGRRRRLHAARVRQHRSVDPGPQLVRNGPTIPGRVGGVTTSRIIFLSSCLPIILALPSRWKATFNFVTGGIQAALQHALDASNGQDVRLGGGVSTIRQYLSAGLIDEMHLGIAPVLLGSGEHLLGGLDVPKLGYRVCEHEPTPDVTHIVIKKTA